MDLLGRLGFIADSQASHDKRIRDLKSKAAKCKTCGGKNTRPGWWRCCGGIWSDITYLEKEWADHLAEREWLRRHPGFQ